ncbi:MAG: DUF1638 domain-containing protein [Treponemataceae bacterium]
MLDSERFRLIACGVFTRELCAAIALSPRAIDPLFLELAAHEQSDRLRSLIQGAVDDAEGKGYSTVLLGYGLCGNALAGVQARSLPLVVPRAHDCCTILLGSSEKFVKEFGESLSASWTSCGYMERNGYMRHSESGRAGGFGLEYDEMVAKYGEDNAQYLWETLHPETDEGVLRFIELDETASLDRAALVRAEAEREGKEFRLIHGDARLLRALLNGPWDDALFLTVPPGAVVEPLYDYELVYRAVAASAAAAKKSVSGAI